MKKNRMQISTLLTLLLCMLLLTACGASAAESEGTDPETPPQESAAAPETEEPSAQQEDVTLEELLGEDYVNYLTETITMQMANRMDKDYNLNPVSVVVFDNDAMEGLNLPNNLKASAAKRMEQGPSFG